MRPDETFVQEARQTLSEWSEPLIGDCLLQIYNNIMHNNEMISAPLVRHHQRFWKCLLSNNRDQIIAARRDLLQLARAARIDAQTVSAADMQVLDELVQIISFRYQHSPRNILLYNRLLIEAAGKLVETRISAAA